MDSINMFLSTYNSWRQQKLHTPIEEVYNLCKC